MGYFPIFLFFLMVVKNIVVWGFQFTSIQNVILEKIIGNLISEVMKFIKQNIYLKQQINLINEFESM